MKILQVVEYDLLTFLNCGIDHVSLPKYNDIVLIIFTWCFPQIKMLPGTIWKAYFQDSTRILSSN